MLIFNPKKVKMEDTGKKWGGARPGAGQRKKEMRKDQQVCVYLTKEDLELLGGKPALRQRLIRYVILAAAKARKLRAKDTNLQNQ